MLRQYINVEPIPSWMPMTKLRGHADQKCVLSGLWYPVSARRPLLTMKPLAWIAFGNGHVGLDWRAPAAVVNGRCLESVLAANEPVLNWLVV